MKRIAAITMARNDQFFLGRWISYYGGQLGSENLYIYLDGLDQEIPKNAENAHIEKLEHTEQVVHHGDKTRILILSKLANKLFADGYDIVIGCDADEFLVLDPNINKSLAQYLSDIKINTSVSGFGMDIGQNIKTESKLNFDKPFLYQRDFALLSTRYTKPVVLSKPAVWGSGFHSVKGHNFHIDKNLYLMHFGSVDMNMIKNKISDRNPSWAKHLKKRSRAITIISNKKTKSELFIKIARIMQTIFRPIYDLNKPAQLGLKFVVKIPKRFKKIGI